jgi:hypothetical protein
MVRKPFFAEKNASVMAAAGRARDLAEHFTTPPDLLRHFNGFSAVLHLVRVRSVVFVFQTPRDEHAYEFGHGGALTLGEIAQRLSVVVV